MAPAQASQIRTMYVSDRKNCINVSFIFNKNKVAKNMLLDSGATDNFIDQRTVNRLHISTRCLTKPCILYNVDKTENKSGRITHYVDLEITQRTQIRVQQFYIANLGTDRFILGFPCVTTFPSVTSYLHFPLPIIPVYSLTCLPRHSPLHFLLPYLHLPTWLPSFSSRTFDSSMLTLLSLLTCTIFRLVPVVAGPSQAFLIFNCSEYDD